MKGNIGLTQDIIIQKVNDNKNKHIFGYMINNNIVTSYATQTHKRYTDILPHKQVYNSVFSEKDNSFCHEFIITNNQNKFLVLKELFLFSPDDVIVNDFYPNIKLITHEIKKDNNKVLLNKFDGESLKAINVVCKYNNKYCLKIPIISSYGVITLLGESSINLQIMTSCKCNFKMLGIFNHVVSEMEIERFATISHQYLNLSFDLHEINLNKGTSTKKINDNSNEIAYYRSIILIADKSANMTCTLKTNNFNSNINLIEIPHLKFDNKVIFLITNSHDKNIDDICNYQPRGTINAQCLDFNFVSEIDCSIKIICQRYNILTLFKEM